MFVGLPGPEPDTFVRGVDPAPDTDPSLLACLSGDPPWRR
jgi:hypothetical protein